MYDATLGENALGVSEPKQMHYSFAYSFLFINFCRLILDFSGEFLTFGG